jgi:hypothetical protein
MKRVDDETDIIIPSDAFVRRTFRVARGRGWSRDRSSEETSLPAPWADLIGDVLTRGQVRTLLHLTADAEVESLEDRGQIIALPDPRQGAMYPSFQFTAAGEVKPEIPRIVNIFTRDPEPDTSYLIVSWLKTPKSYLNGQTPLQWLDLGKDADPVIVGAEQAAARLAS